MVNKALAAGFAAVMTGCAPALAQGYPEKPITLVVPYVPGAATDLVARTVGQKMSESIGQPVIVENRGGGGGTIGSRLVARAAPDGYTIMLGSGATHGIVKFTTKGLAYDPVKDFTALAGAVEVPVVLAVHTSVPANNAREFVEYVKRNPGKVSFGSSGAGSSMHFAGELLKQVAGIDMVHVPYKGGGPAMQDLVGGQVPAVFAILSTAIPQMRAGKIKVLGLAEAKRQPSAPDVPTIGESIPGYAVPSSWLGFFGPAGLPAPVAKRLSGELLKAMRAPDVRARLEAAGTPLVAAPAEQFAAMVKDDIEVWRKIAIGARIEPE